jgi:IS5 family transposase
MRQKRNPQMGLFMSVVNTKIGKELEQMSRILDDTPGLLQVVFNDLVKFTRTDTGRYGLTAEQVLRCAVLKQYRQLSYEELAFHLDDSAAFRRFARLEMGQYPSKSILQDNIESKLAI